MQKEYEIFESYAKELTILLAEDNDSVYAVEQELLAMFFKEIDHATNGAAALEMYKTKNYDLVLSDINMPLMDGVELAREIKKLNAEQPVVMVSAQNDATTLFELINIGVDSFILKPFRIENTITSLYAICKNIHDAKQNRRQISMLLNAVEQSPEPIIIANPAGIIEYVNPAFVKLMEYSSPEVIGQHFTCLESGLMSEEFYAEMRRRIFNRELWQGELINRKKNGEICYVKASVSPVYDQEGNLIHFVAVEQDITSLKKMQQHLVQSQKLEAVGQLAAGISHEINTPIQYIGDNLRFLDQATKSMLTIIEEATQNASRASETPAELEQICHQITKSLSSGDIEFFKEEIPLSLSQSLEGIGHISKIIKAMKEFAHPGSKEKEPIDINRIIENTVIISRNEWKYASTLTTDLEEELPLINGYANEISQVILNMLINSAHAIHEKYNGGNTGKGEITISTRSTASEVIITIHDTGTGIPKTNISRLFDPFFTTKEVGKGTGQGLYLAHDIIFNHHKGRIETDTREGEWTEFTIRLPR